MEFRKCWIAGTSYGFGTTEIGRAALARGLASTEVESEETKAAQREADPQRAQFFYDPKIGFDDVRIRHRIETRHRDHDSLQDFFRVLSVAHTVVPEGDPGKLTPDKVKYQAESPDEGALVHAARVLGFCFLGKTATTHTVNIFGEMETYEMLQINKFTSSRKRMSAVVRTPDGDIELYMKGADNVMFERIRAGENIAEVEEVVKAYGREGLRTLIIAKRKISNEEYERWKIQFQAASTALSGRDELLAQAAEDIEYDLKVLGATAIEDKLQIGVPDAIATLALARIRIWVLTGDKQETAENIGFACNLLRDEMERVYLVTDSAQELQAIIQEATLSRFQFFEKDDPCEQLALIVDGKALLCIMAAVENPNATPQEIELMTKFLSFAKMCKAVIACRVSPDQKRQIVAMVKLNTKPVPMTLAIGDGANDVPMILEASVGIGISGNEGMQAVRSSDYAIAQFAYLKRLLLVHGRSNYKRVSTVVMYSLYKNCFLVSSLFIYGMFTGWTGTALYDSLMLAGFNVGWAFAGIIVFGTIENDVSPTAALAYPQLYGTGVRKADFNIKVLIQWEFIAVYHTVLCFLVPAYCFLGKIVRVTADDDGLVTFGMCQMQALVVAVNLKLMLVTSNLTYISVVAYLGSIILFMIGGLTHSLWALSSFFASENYVFYNIMPFLYASISNWLIQILTVVCVLIPEVIVSYVKRNFFPDLRDVVRELDLGYGEGLMAHATAPKSEIEIDEKDQKN
jgi:phospholipid-translocating P-type ATPase (flippase)